TFNDGAYNPWREVRKTSVIFTHRQREEATRRPRGTQESTLGGLAILLLLLGGSALAGMRGLLAGQGVQALLLSVIGLCWLLGRRQYAGWRWLWRQVSRGRPLFLVLMLGAALSGCESMERGVAKLHGVQVDPLPGPCAPESFQAGQCLKVKQEGARP
ncbi:MAG TPA: hypothetical protein VLQ80_11705, partial [Candidatus Saccharimonadia bacterium]|nr:hypothetical protein [Candidatus Saccharimonadia bacterium]